MSDSLATQADYCQTCPPHTWHGLPCNRPARETPHQRCDCPGPFADTQEPTRD